MANEFDRLISEGCRIEAVLRSHVEGTQMPLKLLVAIMILLLNKEFVSFVVDDAF